MIQGQMLPSSKRGEIIKKYIKKYKPKNVVEIGTWKGLGSTLCILESIENDTKFYSIESNKDFYLIAKKNLESHLNKVNLIQGKIIEYDDVIKFISDKNLTENQKIWLQEDLNNINESENILELLPKNIDFLLLDGGEFSTYPEWVKIRDRVSIVALDDIRELKCNQIYKELILDNNYFLLEETNDGNGFCIFILKK